MQRQSTILFHDGPIPLSLVMEKLDDYQSSLHLGAYQVFMGQVRADQVEGKRVQKIDYTAYPEMAQEGMEKIRQDLLGRYEGLLGIEVIHSLGGVAVGGICLVAIAVSGHRQEANKACMELVERIKKELPIWGKEYFEESGYQWKVNK